MVADSHAGKPLALLVDDDAADAAEQLVDERRDRDRLPGDECRQRHRRRRCVAREASRVDDDVTERRRQPEGAGGVGDSGLAAARVGDEDRYAGQRVVRRVLDRSDHEGVAVGEVDSWQRLLGDGEANVPHGRGQVAIELKCLDLDLGAVGEDGRLDRVGACRRVGVGVMLVAIRAGGDHHRIDGETGAVEEMAADGAVADVNEGLAGDGEAVGDGERADCRGRVAGELPAADLDAAGVTGDCE